MSYLYLSSGDAKSVCLIQPQTTLSSAQRCLPNVLNGFTTGSDMRDLSRKDERTLSQCGHSTWIF